MLKFISRIINEYLISRSSTMVGTDQYGNKYYVAHRSKNATGKTRRFVIYSNEFLVEESTFVPPIWHAWLHYLADDTPNYGERFEKHRANMTGTSLRHLPKVTGVYNISYQKWTPVNPNLKSKL